jgi:hypothetical protein
MATIALKVIATTETAALGTLVTEAIATVPANNPAQALDRALNMLERHETLTGEGFSIAEYTTKLVEGDGMGLWFEVHIS